MKRILFSFALFLLAGDGFAQKGFGVDGSIGLGRNNGDPVYPLLIEGRIQLNNYFSANFGLGLWNSGFKDSWEGNKTPTTATLLQMSSDKTLPTLQFGPRAQVPVFSINDKKVRFFVEPKLYFLPFSAQTVDLKKTYYNITTNALTGDEIYTPTGVTENASMKSECHPRLYGGFQTGLSIELVENMDFAISYGYTNMDLFKDLRGQSLDGILMDGHLPKTDLQLINLSIRVNFDLN